MPRHALLGTPHPPGNRQLQAAALWPTNLDEGGVGGDEDRDENEGALQVVEDGVVWWRGVQGRQQPEYWRHSKRDEEIHKHVWRYAFGQSRQAGPPQATFTPLCTSTTTSTTRCPGLRLHTQTPPRLLPTHSPHAKTGRSSKVLSAPPQQAATARRCGPPSCTRCP